MTWRFSALEAPDAFSALSVARWSAPRSRGSVSGRFGSSLRGAEATRGTSTGLARGVLVSLGRVTRTKATMMSTAAVRPAPITAQGYRPPVVRWGVDGVSDEWGLEPGPSFANAEWALPRKVVRRTRFFRHLARCGRLLSSFPFFSLRRAPAA